MSKKLGATGEFPKGKLNEDDEGGLQFAIALHKNKLIMDFGKPVHWIGMGKTDAIMMANKILEYANKIK